MGVHGRACTGVHLRTPPYRGERAWAYTSVHPRTWPSVHRRAGACRGVHARAYKGVHRRAPPYIPVQGRACIPVHGRTSPYMAVQGRACMAVHARTGLHLKGAPPGLEASRPAPRRARPFPFRGSSGVRGPQAERPGFKGEGGLLNAPAPGVQRFKAAIRRGFGPSIPPFESPAWPFKPPLQSFARPLKGTRGSCQDVCVSVCVRGAYRS